MNIALGLAASPEDIRDATNLITSVYQKAGYAREGESSSISAFLVSPATVSFTARAHEKLIGTISVIADSAAGLPMDLIFKDVLDAMRAQGLRLAEAGQFAVDREVLKVLQATSPGEAVDRVVSLSLVKLGLQYGLRRGFDIFCIAVNPKHEGFYRWMGFETFAETRDYPSVENAPAVPMKIAFAELRRQAGQNSFKNALLAEIFAHPPEESLLIKALTKGASQDRNGHLLPSPSALDLRIGLVR